MSTKPKEFWIEGNVAWSKDDLTPSVFPELCTHVIEYSAYEAMKQERDDYKLGAESEAHLADIANAEAKKLADALLDLYEAMKYELGIEEFDILPDTSVFGIAKQTLNEYKGNK